MKKGADSVKRQPAVGLVRTLGFAEGIRRATVPGFAMALEDLSAERAMKKSKDEGIDPVT